MWFSYVAITVIVGLVLLTFDSTVGLFSSSQPFQRLHVDSQFLRLLGTFALCTEYSVFYLFSIKAWCSGLCSTKAGCSGLCSLLMLVVLMVAAVVLSFEY